MNVRPRRASSPRGRWDRAPTLTLTLTFPTLTMARTFTLIRYAFYLSWQLLHQPGLRVAYLGRCTHRALHPVPCTA